MGLESSHKSSQRAETFHGAHVELINNAHQKAKRLLSREEIDFESFSDLYTPEDIQRDAARVEELEGKFEQDGLQEKMALAAEAIFYEQVALSGWLSSAGVQVFVEKTSKVDDFLNGTDMVFTFVTKDNEEPLSVTVDVTMGVLSLNKKIHSLKQEIDKKTLGTVKYHETLSGEHTKLEHVPHVLLGIEPEELTHLMKLWVQDSVEAKELLKAHPVQLALVRQIEEQLISFQKYAQMCGDTGTAEKYQALIDIMLRVRVEKEGVYSAQESEELFRMLGMLRRTLQSQLIFPGSQVPVDPTKKSSTIANRIRRS